MAFNSRKHTFPCGTYMFWDGELCKKGKKNLWHGVDHIRDPKYKAIADKIREIEPYNG